MSHDGPSNDSHDSSASDIGQNPSTAADRAESGNSGSTKRAVIGAVVTFLTTFFVPLAPVVGGATAGYLEGGETDDGLRVGAISGALALVPLIFVVPLVLVFFFVDAALGAFALAIAAVSVLFLAAYTVGLSALGGVIGVYLDEEF